MEQEERRFHEPRIFIIFILILLLLLLLLFPLFSPPPPTAQRGVPLDIDMLATVACCYL